MLKPKNKKKMNPQELGQIYKRELDQAKWEFEQLEFPCESEGGEVKVVLTGRREIKTLTLSQEIMQCEKDRVERLITSVINQALTTVRDANVQLTDTVAKKFTAQYS